MKNFSIKTIGLTLFLLCALAPLSYAGHDVIYLCQGSTYSWNLSEYASPNDTIVYVSGPNDWTIFYDNAQYDTVEGNTIQVSPSQDRLYKVISINGNPIVGCPIYLTVYVRVAPTISIPQNLIRHVTCPDGWTYPYSDGAFHVDLDDSVQNYAWINVSNESVFSLNQAYDSVTLTGLRSGTYYVTAHGINGCDYTDSVVIEQPDPWVDYGSYLDTVCFGTTGCMEIGLYGGTPPYTFTWFYWEYTENGIDTIFLPDTTRMACGLSAGGKVYFIYMYDSKGCKMWGEEIDVLFGSLYEYVEDSTHIITTDSIACYGGDFLVQAQSIGLGTYTWYVGDVADSVNYWTSIYGDSMFVADYYTPQITEPTWIYAEFSDQHHCVTRDSIWVEVYNPDVSMSVVTTQIVTDSICTIQVSPSGGDLYLDDIPIAYNIPGNYTFSTAGISVGEHTLKYAGIFGAEMGLACEDEISIPIQVETNPFVPEWGYDISIYPNPATTVLNLYSTGISDFELSILDITGKVIKSDRMSDQRFTIDVSDLSSGVYMLRLVSHDGASKVVKFVKR